MKLTIRVPTTYREPVTSPDITIVPLQNPPDAAVRVPGSKSHSNRALLCAGLARGVSRLGGVLDAADTRAMMGALTRLGATVNPLGPVDPVGSVDIEIKGPVPFGLVPEEQTGVDVAQSGTTGRFLLAALATLPGRFLLDGDEQLRRRPFGQQIEALRRLGADIKGDGLPLHINGQPLSGRRASVPGTTSSQFLSGLLLAAPCFQGPATTIELETGLVSRPYVELTLAVMADFGIEVEVDQDFRRFTVPAGRYQPTATAIEPDASAASYFFAAAAMTEGTVRIDGLGRSTVQGDIGFVSVLGQMGADVTVADNHTIVTGPPVLRGVTVDMADISDTAQTLAVVATRADSPTTITGIGFIRDKETDRIAAPVAELTRLGIRAEATDDGMIIYPGRPNPGVVRTYDDHRMAMSFALLGLCHPGIVVADPSCVAKTFPRFFDAVDQLRVGRL